VKKSLEGREGSAPHLDTKTKLTPNRTVRNRILRKLT